MDMTEKEKVFGPVVTKELHVEPGLIDAPVDYTEFVPMVREAVLGFPKGKTFTPADVRGVMRIRPAKKNHNRMSYALKMLATDGVIHSVSFGKYRVGPAPKAKKKKDVAPPPVVAEVEVEQPLMSMEIYKDHARIPLRDVADFIQFLASRK